MEKLKNSYRLIAASSAFKANSDQNTAALYAAAKQDRLEFWQAQAKQLTWFNVRRHTLIQRKKEGGENF